MPVHMVAPDLCLLVVQSHLQIHEPYFCLVFHFSANSGLNENSESFGGSLLLKN